MIPADESGDMTTVKNLLQQTTDAKTAIEDGMDATLQSALKQVGISSTKSLEIQENKQDTVEVFIGGLEKDIKDDIVLQAVSQVVEGATSLRIARRKRSGDCRGWATIRVPDLESAQKLCDELRQVNGQFVGVHISRGKPLGPTGFPYYLAEYYQPVEPPVEDGSLKKVFDVVRGSVDKQGLLMSTIRGVFYPRPYWDEVKETEENNQNMLSQSSKGQGQGSGQNQRQFLFNAGGNSYSSPPAKKRKKEEIQCEPIEVTMQRECMACTALLNKFKSTPNGQNKTALAILHEYASRLGLEVHYEEQVDESSGLFRCCARLCKTGNVITLFAEGTGSGRSKKDAKQLSAAYVIESLLKKVPEQDFMCSFTKEKKKMGNPRAGIGTRTQRFRQVSNPNTSAVAAKSAIMTARQCANNQFQGSGTSGAYGTSTAFSTFNNYGTTSYRGAPGNASTPPSTYGQKTAQAFKKGGNLTNVTTTNFNNNNNNQYQQQYQQNQYAGGYSQSTYQPVLNASQQYGSVGQQYGTSTQQYGTANQQYGTVNSQYDGSYSTPYKPTDAAVPYQTPALKNQQTEVLNVSRGMYGGTVVRGYDQTISQDVPKQQHSTTTGMDAYNQHYEQYASQYQNQHQSQPEQQYAQNFQLYNEKQYGQRVAGNAGKYMAGADYSTPQANLQQTPYEAGQKRTHTNMMQQHAPNAVPQAQLQQQQQPQQQVQQQQQQQPQQQQQQMPQQQSYQQYYNQFYGLQGGYNQGASGTVPTQPSYANM